MRENERKVSPSVAVSKINTKLIGLGSRKRLTRENVSIWRKASPSATLPITHDTWIGQGSNPIVRSGRPQTNHPSYI
jgi:hypothetical protein